MKKVAFIFLAICVLATGLQGLAADTGTTTPAGLDAISYDKARASLIANSSILKKLSNAVTQALIRYNSAAEASKSINVDYVEYGGFRFSYDAYTRMLLTKQRDLQPLQMKNYLNMARENRTITQNSLVIGLRGMYLSLMSADNTMKSKREGFLLAEVKHKESKLKYKNGLISELDMEEATYSYDNAKAEYDAAVRNRENALRSFNSYLGSAINLDYSEVRYDEVYVKPDLKPVEEYVKRALEKRQDINRLKKDIELKELEMSIVAKSWEMGTTYSEAVKEHKALERQIADLRLILQKTQLSVENEVKSAYLDIIDSANSVENMIRTNNTQQNSLKKMKASYAAGLISVTALKQIEIAAREVENGLMSMIFNHNTNVMRFTNATGLGPAY